MKHQNWYSRSSKGLTIIASLILWGPKREGYLRLGFRGFYVATVTGMLLMGHMNFIQPCIRLEPYTMAHELL